MLPLALLSGAIRCVILAMLLAANMHGTAPHPSSGHRGPSPSPTSMPTPRATPTPTPSSADKAGGSGPSLWSIILGSAGVTAIIASVITTFGNNALQSRREEKTRLRKAVGVLQRARSSATMLLQAVEVAKEHTEHDVSRTTTALTEVMLSKEFTTATADLELQDVYRALERLNGDLRSLSSNSLALATLYGDSRRTQIEEGPHGEMWENDDYDPDVEKEYSNCVKAQSWLAEKMTRDATAIRDELGERQRDLSNKL